MAYMNKQLCHYVELADKKFKIPSSFNKFIERQKVLENLILKNHEYGFCTYCKKRFVVQKKINQKAMCPYCHKSYLIKRFDLKNYENKKDLILLDKVEDKFVLRIFELYSTYIYISKEFEHYCTEYKRIFFDENNYIQIVEGDNVARFMNRKSVLHNFKRTCWKKKEFKWYSDYDNGIICPYNIKNLLKNTKYQYCQLWKFVRKIKVFSLIDLFQTCLGNNYIAFELLVKMKLYNLAFQSHLFYGKTFEERFGVSKEFLPFMQKYNIEYDELQVLKYCKITNIKLIRSLIGCRDISWLNSHIDLLTAWKFGLLSHNNIHEYVDYLGFAIQLGYNLKDKKILYPANLRKEHDKLQKEIITVKNKENSRLLKERYNLLKKNIYKSKHFIIYPVHSSNELIIESQQQNNCVKTYVEKVALAKCDIYFMRKSSTPSESLVTVEVRGNKIVQAKIKNNQEPTKEQWEFLNVWQKKILNKGGIINA